MSEIFLPKMNGEKTFETPPKLPKLNMADEDMFKAKNCYVLEDGADAKAEMEHQLKLGKSSDFGTTSMQKFYAGSSVLVTGGTGFLGKVLIEKLLRSCPDVEKVYMIVRTKKGKDESSRVHDMLNDILFQRLRKEQPNFASKVVTLPGDFALEGMGLSDEDRQTIIDKVSIIIHGAATVRFDERLDVAAMINVRGTRGLLALARMCRHLKAYTHISSAYVNCDKDGADEKFYDPPMDYDNLMSLVAVDDKLVEAITPTVLGKYPNTYTFTKAIAEDTVKKCAEGMPVCIVRPGIIISTYEEPIRGWTDNLYGPTGVIVGIGTGILRTLQLDIEKKAEMVPVDMTANCILASTWDTAMQFKENQTSDIPIYHFVSGEQMPVTWGEFINLNKKHGEDKPTVRAVWYYGFSPQKYRPLYLIYAFFLHFIPALLADTVLTIMGRKKMMLKVIRKIEKFNTCLTYFTTREWKFTDMATRKLWKRIEASDQTIFPFDMAKLSWDYHSETHLLGLRVYLVKDDMSTLPQAKIKWRRLFYLHNAVKILFFLLVGNIVWSTFLLIKNFIL